MHHSPRKRAMFLSRSMNGEDVLAASLNRFSSGPMTSVVGSYKLPTKKDWSTSSPVREFGKD